MPRQYSTNSKRSERVGDMLQQTLALLILREISDPRLQMVSISKVKVSSDLAHAKVYISVLGDDEKAEEALQALTKANGYLRKLLAKECELRIVPQLQFIYDDSVVEGRRLSSLIDKAVASDRKTK